MSLAAEIGDPSLIYKFMAVARHNSIWSTRAAFGGRYGFAKILSETDQNPKLYPKLFRYRFDPSPAVRKSMDEIWGSLVKDSNATIMEYFDLIMEDLLKTIVDREWRVRESSCMALSDLIQGKPLEKVCSPLPYVPNNIANYCCSITNFWRGCGL
jgi:proteasome component ECM29